MLVNMQEILTKAQEGGYAVIAPNIFSLECVLKCIEAAEEKNSPIIIDHHVRKGLDEALSTGRFVERCAHEAKVPVAYNQDHGKNFESSIIAIRAGFTSIMVDRSSLPFEENVAQVAELTRIAHAAGLSVESELGHVGFGAQYEVDGKTALTDPAEAAEFVGRTQIDFLAIAIGTAHGQYSGEPYLDFERLEEIKKVVKIPLVLHGGSSTGDERLAKAAKAGICKINIATDSVLAGYEALMSHGKPRGALEAFYAGYKAKIIHYIDVFGSAGKA